jgi:hypothetical protein
MTLKSKVQATPTFKRTSLTEQRFQRLVAVPRRGPDLAFNSNLSLVVGIAILAGEIFAIRHDELLVGVSLLPWTV